jgi:hypothetical protein
MWIRNPGSYGVADRKKGLLSLGRGCSCYLFLIVRNITELITKQPGMIDCKPCVICMIISKDVPFHEAKTLFQILPSLISFPLTMVSILFQRIVSYFLMSN